ncbi:HET-domain-containing protein, partial [Macroventuria anomochaeta]
IRILTVYPSAKEDATLEASLYVADLKPLSPSYEALSYVWGDSLEATSLLIQGYHLPITDNSFSALRRIQHQYNLRDLWVDAVCTDQSSSSDKNDQVNRMYQIYSRAKNTIICLGELDDDTDRAMDRIEGMGGGENSYLYDYAPNEEEMRRIKTVLERPWWSRVWTMQGSLVFASGLLQCLPAVRCSICYRSAALIVQLIRLARVCFHTR